MTEQEWFTCTNPTPMLAFLRSRVSDRKLHLFACACYRLIWHLLPDEGTSAPVENAESRADQPSVTPAGEEPADPDAEELWYHPVMTDDPVHSYVTARMLEVIQTIEVAEHERYLRNPDKLHPRFAVESELSKISALVRDIIANPFCTVTIDPAWLTPNVTDIAKGIHDDRAFERLPILADALEDAGCNNADILDHCRQPGEHALGCWAVDLLLGKV